MREELQSLQKERVYKEIEKVMKLENPSLFFETLVELGVLDIIFPSLYKLTTCHENNHSLFEHAIYLLKKLSYDSIALKFTALYYHLQDYDEPAIQTPMKIKKRIHFLIHAHKKLLLLKSLKAEEIAEFFASFKKERTLFDDLLCLYHAFDKKIELEEKKMRDTFDAISSYSPKEWIDAQTPKPSAEAIQKHLHAIHTAFVKKYLVS
jgi:tRNA nucleotidyltransferase (CCA-adding enzyme)